MAVRFTIKQKEKNHATYQIQKKDGGIYIYEDTATFDNLLEGGFGETIGYITAMFANSIQKMKEGETITVNVERK